MKPGDVITSTIAIGMLPDRDYVHVMQCKNERGAVVFGSSKCREWVTDIILRGKCRIADESFQKVGHGIQVDDAGHCFLFETAEHSSYAAGVAYAEASR